MLHQRTQKSSASHPQTQQQSSQFAPRPFAIQAQPETQKPATQEEIENEAFNQNKFEAFGLQLKEKSGTIAPEEQERLGVLQAKMNDLMVQRQERTSRFGFNLIGIPIHSPDATGNAPIQTKLGQKSDREGEQQQSPQESSETVSNEGMDLVQRTFQKTNPQSHPVSPIQAKLTIGQPGDKYEQEADSVAAKVVEKINAPASGQSTQGQSVQRQEEDQEEEVQAKPEISALQRMEEPKEEDIQAKLIQKQGDAIAQGEASTDLDTAINSARGGGQPLDAGLQRSMGQAMGADFSGVRVHTDSHSDRLNQSIQAKAFTTGQDVFFRQGAYDPGSRGGQELIAHELTHVVQQSGGAVQRSQTLMIGSEKREAVIQRNIENETIKDEENREISHSFFKAYNDAVQKAYEYAVNVPSLGAYKNLNGYTQLWATKWQEHLSGLRPKLMAATFGYVIESLVSNEGSHLRPKISGDYSVDTQVTSGGTRPDLVLRLRKGSNHIAWLDLTASGSVDHIYTKDDWSSKVSNFAEVTYPSLDPATLALMKQNKDNTGKEAISNEEFEKRRDAAQEEYIKNKNDWTELGKNFTYIKLRKSIGLPLEILELQPEKKQQFILDKLKTHFVVAELDKKMVPSILSAMRVNSIHWGYTTGYSSSEKAGEAWLIDNWTN